MANKELMITLGLDATSFTQKVKKAKDLNKELDKSFELLASSSKNFENSMQGLGKKQDYLNQKIKLASAEADIYAERLQECQEALQDSVADTTHYAEQLKRLERQQEAVGKALGTTSKEYLAITEKVKSMTQLLDKANKAWITNDKRVTEASVGYKNAQISVQGLTRDLTLTTEKLSAMRADEGMKELSEAIKESQRGFENIKNSVVGFDNTMEGLDKTQTHYTSQVDKMNELLGMQKSELNASKKILSDYEDELSRLNIQVSDYNELMSMMDGSENEFHEIRAEAEALRIEYSNLNKTVEFHKDRINSLNSEYKANEATMSKFKQNIDATSKKMIEMNSKVTFEPISKQIKELTNGNITKLENQLSKLEEEFDIVTTSAKGYENTMTGLSFKQTNFNKSLSVAGKALTEYKKELTSIKTETEKLTNEQKELEQEISKQVSSLSKLKGVDWDSQAKSIERLKVRYEEVNKSLDLHNKRVKSLEAGYSNSRKNVASLASELKETKIQMEALNRASKLDALDNTIKKTNTELEKLESEFKVAKSEVINFSNTKQGLVKTTEMYNQKLRLLSTQMDNYKRAIVVTDKEIEKLETQQNKLSQSCDKLRLKLASLDESSPKYTTTVAELARLENQMKETSAEADRLRNSSNQLQNELNEATAETNELRVAQNRLNSEFRANQFERIGNSMKSFGSGLTNLGNALMPVTYTAIGAMTAIGKTGIEFDAQMSKVGALTGETGEKLQETMKILEEGARELAKNSRFSATEMAQGLEDLVLAGYDAEKAITTLPLAMDFAQAGSIELATATEDLVMALSSLGNNSELTGNDLENMTIMANQIALVANATTTDLDGLAKSILKVGGQVENMKIPLSTATTMIGILGDKGILAEEAGNSLNSILINLTQSSGQSAEAMEALGLSAFDAEGNIKPIEKTLGELKKKLDSFDGDKQEIILTNMLGGKTQAKTLQKLLQGIDAQTGDFTEKYKNLKTELQGTIDLSQLKNGKTALQEMSEAMNNNLKGDIYEMTSALQEGAISIFEKYEPQIREFVQSLTEGIKNITDKIVNMTPAQQELLASIAKWAVIAPMTLKVIGGLTSGLGGLATGASKAFDMFKDVKSVVNAGRAMSTTATAVSDATIAMSGASSSIAEVSLASKLAGKAILGLGTFIGGLSTPVLIGAGAVTALGVAGVATAKQLSKETIPEIDVFADKVETSTKTVQDANGQMVTSYETTVTKIGEGTKQAVGSYLELDEGVRNAMSNLYINSSVISAEIATDMQNRFKTLGDTIRTGIDKNAEESINSLNTLFANSKALSEEEKAKALENEKLFYEQKKTNVSEIENKIIEIMRTASEQKRALTLEETQTIQELQNQLRESAIKTLSEQEVESQVILQRMKDNDTRLTAEMVSENVKKLNEQRDNAISSAEAQYEETVRLANRAFSETGSITEDQKNKIIEEARLQKEGVVQKAKETHEEALKKIEELGGDTVKAVDRDTGKIWSFWDKLFGKWDNWSPKKKKFEAETVETTRKVVVTEQKSAPATQSLASAQSLVENTMRTMSNIPVALDFESPSLNMRNYKTSGGLYNSATKESSVVKSNLRNNGSGGLIDALVQQNQLLIQLLTDSTINIGVNVDGKQIARASAKYMEAEINTLTKRRNRIGGLAY